MGKKLKIFLSYAKEDSQAVEEIAQYLQEAGLDVFDWRDPLKRGQRFIQRIQDEIRGADAFLVIVSPAYVASKYCGREADFAIQLDNRRSDQYVYIAKVKPVDTEDAGFLGSYDWFDLTGENKEEEIQALINRLGGNETIFYCPFKLI